MAFQLKGNIFNKGTGSPLLNSNKCLKYGIVNGKSECIKRSREATRPSKAFSEDPDERAKQEQWIKDNPEKYKELLAQTKTQISTRDIKSGETNTFPKGMYGRLQLYKKANDPAGWKNWLKHHNIDPKDPNYQAVMKKAKRSAENRALKAKRKEERAKYCERNPEECYKKSKTKVVPSNTTKPNRTTTTKDTLGKWSDYK
jgi:hypothetical protein